LHWAPASNYLLKDVDVELEWQTYEFDGITPIDGTDHEETLTVSAEQQANGINWFVPYDKCLKPTYRPPISGGNTAVNRQRLPINNVCPRVRAGQQQR
jgi:hypothetical protein